MSVCVEKYDKKERLPCLWKRYDFQTHPIHACTGINHTRHFISSRFILQQLETILFI